jgi:D-3-phosphoglycerate dehydrogenase
MKIVIPDDYQDVVHRLACFSMLDGHEVKRYREPARHTDELVARLQDADIVVEIRERVALTRSVIECLPKLKLIALVGSRSRAIDIAACTERGIRVARGESGSPEAPAELAVALMLAARRHVVTEAERMRRGEWPSTLSHRLRGSMLGIFGLGHIGRYVAAAGHGLGMHVLV